MLYIDKQYGDNLWTVLDTDDMHSDYVEKQDIDYVSSLGIKIHGVKTHREGKKVIVDSIGVFDKDTVIARDIVKLKVIKGVDIKVSDGLISHISFDKVPGLSEIGIRLSDFGQVCGARIIGYGRALPCKVTIILDDKITILPDTFKDSLYAGNLILDIREMTNEEQVDYVYESVFSHYLIGTDFMQTVIDVDSRKQVYCGMKAVYSGARENYVPSDYVNYEVQRRFRGRFYALMSSRLRVLDPLSDGVSAHIMFDNTKTRLEPDADFWRSYSTDFREVYRKFDGMLFDLPEHMGWDSSLSIYLNNFLTYFRPDNEFKQTYVEMCNRVANFLLDMIGCP